MPVAAALLLAVGVAHADDATSESELTVPLCLSDGQTLVGTRVVEYPHRFELELAGAFVRVPRRSWAPECGAPDGAPTNRGEAWTYLLPGMQPLFGTPIALSGGVLTLSLLDHHRIFVPDELVVGGQGPRFVDAARQKNAALTWQIPVILGVVVGLAGLTAGLLYAMRNVNLCFVCGA